MLSELQVSAHLVLPRLGRLPLPPLSLLVTYPSFQFPKPLRHAIDFLHYGHRKECCLHTNPTADTTLLQYQVLFTRFAAGELAAQFGRREQ